MAKSMGDSGTFGSQKTIDAIGKAQAKKKPTNKVAAQLTGKYQSKSIMGKVKKAAGKMFSN